MGLTREKMLRVRIRVHADSLERLAGRLSTDEEYPNDAPRRLCARIAATARLLGRFLDKTPDDRLMHVAEIISEIAQDLRYAERARTTQTPWSIIQATEAFLKA